VNTISEFDLCLIEDAAKGIGLSPSRYTVRDSTTVHVNGRYWNPLNPNRADFWQVLAGLKSIVDINISVTDNMNSVQIAVDAGSAYWGPRERLAAYSISGFGPDFEPASFCRALTEVAAQLFRSRP
jgi:hypothetical protein